MTSESADLLAEPRSQFFAMLSNNELIAFRSFGEDGQVPGGTYDDSALDTGGGLRPDLTGRGIGRSVVEAGLAFGQRRFMPAAFRVTVASDNSRALTVLRGIGFTRVDEFDGTKDAARYVILIRPADDR